MLKLTWSRYRKHYGAGDHLRWRAALLHELVSRANQWIEQQHIDVLNVETVLVTKLPDGDDASPAARMDSQGMTMLTYQIVRLWYRQAPARPLAYTGQTTRLEAE